MSLIVPTKYFRLILIVSLKIVISSNGTGFVILENSDPPSSFSHSRVINLGRIFSSSNSVIFFDVGPCWWAAVAYYDRSRTGGELVWCQSILKLLLNNGYQVYVTNEPGILEAVVTAARTQLKNIVIVVHWGWRMISKNNDGIINPLFGENCIIKMGYYGRHKCNLRDDLWPGDFAKYLAPFPSFNNTFSGFGNQFSSCSKGFSRNDSELFLSLTLTSSDEKLFRVMYDRSNPYGVVFGKWGTVVHAYQIHHMFRNKTVWTRISEVATVVVLQCHPSLFEALNTNDNTLRCLDFASIFRSSPFYDILIRRATFVLGLGAPFQSTTPLEALACGTTVILPRRQHPYLETRSLALPMLHIVANSEEMLRTVCNVTASKKRSTSESVSLDPEVSRDVLSNFAAGERQLLALVRRVQRECSEGRGDLRLSYNESLKVYCNV